LLQQPVVNDLYGVLFQGLLYPGWEAGVRRRPTLRHLERLERTQWCSLDELHELQTQELKKLLAHAWQRVPHYRQTFERAGFEPSSLKSLDDLEKLPFLTRAEATLHLEARKSTAPPLPTIDKATSGTTGNPLTFAYDRGSEYWRQATKLRGYAWAGYELGDRSLHFWGARPLAPPPLATRLKVNLDRSLRREHFVDCTDNSEAALARIVVTLRKLRPSVIVCYAQAGAALARYVNATGCRDWGDIAVIAAAERLFPADRAALTAAFGPAIFETYGNREVMLIAAECEAHAGMHVSMENLIVELIVRDANGARRARPGESGEVAVTDLHNYGAPFIRYLTGDLAIEQPPGRCACGRSLTLLAGVEGRATDTLRDGAGQPVNGMFFSVLFASLADRVRHFQVIQRKDSALDIRLVPANPGDDSLPGLVREHCQKFIRGLELRVELVSQLTPDRGGKLRVVAVES
jgi:phenylacetate-CoA ligase